MHQDFNNESSEIPLVERRPLTPRQRRIVAELAAVTFGRNRNPGATSRLFVIAFAAIAAGQSVVCCDWRLAAGAAALLPSYYVCRCFAEVVARGRERRVDRLPLPVRNEYDSLVRAAVREALVRALPAITVGASLIHSGVGFSSATLVMVLGGLGFSLPPLLRGVAATRELLDNATGQLKGTGPNT